MPYYKYNLADYLKNNWVRLGNNPHIVVSIVLQIIYGLVELGVAHRDLKLSNILIRDLD
jgi:serine/threonine protein kinase